jgi:hypothetical protein
VKKSFGGPRNNIRMNLKEIDCEAVDWMHLAQDRDQT